MGHFECRLDVESFQHTIPLDISENDGSDAGISKAAGEIDGREVGGFRPALDGHPA